MNKISEIIEDYQFKGKSAEGVAAEILALIPANMEIPPYFPGSGIKTEERRNLILGRNAGLDEVRKIMGGKR